jgi:hypothetical protein
MENWETDMENTTNDALAERVERLERQNRNLKRVGTGILLGAVFLLIAGAGGEKVVETERLVLSKGGLVRAVLETDSDGVPSLRRLDEKGKPRLDLSLTHGPFLNMWSSMAHPK